MSRGAFTTCAARDCPRLVAATGCWCWEHLEVCEDGCAHPAHDCREPVHYCHEHQEDAL